jgi:putative Ca2+/H+ antiporter (TMEM165/GDT1 family)
VVFAARYADLPLVFLSVLAGLVCAVAVQTTLGNRLGRILTQKRLRVFSAVVFLALGLVIVVPALA